MLSCAAQNIFADAGVEWKWYRYYEPKTVGLDFEGMMEDLRSADEGSVVILHGMLDSSLSLPGFFRRSPQKRRTLAPE